MKTSIIIACLILCCFISSMIAQDTIRRKMINPTDVTLISDPSFHYKGALFQVNDSSIMISSSTRLKDYRNDNFLVSEVYIIDIQIIKTLSRTKARNGALIGAASGFVLGGLIGLVSGDDSGGYISFSAEEKALGAGIALIPVGAFAGAIIGSFSIKIPINGSMYRYDRKKAMLNKYSIYK